jgi:hypothetical protein
MGGDGKQTYAFKAELSYGAIVQEGIYMKSVPRLPMSAVKS